jgi:ribulose-phosphate 3-epimerase
MLIVPSPLTNNSDELKKMIAKSEEVVERFQIDIVDGVFANNKSVDPTVLKYIETDLNLEFHLMVVEPANWIEKCASVGADTIIGQIEMMSSQLEFVRKVQEVGARVGLALNIDTPLAALDETPSTDLDYLLLMSYPAGVGGQKFDERVYQKIKEATLLRARDDSPFKICVDGGVDKDNICTLARMKVDEVAIGKRLFEGDFKSNITALQSLVSSV